MISSAGPRPTGTRRGAILLELLVSLGIFVLAASLLLATISDVVTSIDRDGIAARAVDLARTRLSELEAGLISIEDLRAESSRLGAAGADSSASAKEEDRLVVDATLSRSAFTGLSLIELRVFDRSDATATPRFVLRQLVSLPSDRRAAERSARSDVVAEPLPSSEDLDEASDAERRR